MKPPFIPRDRDPNPLDSNTAYHLTFYGVIKELRRIPWDFIGEEAKVIGKFTGSTIAIALTICSISDDVKDGIPMNEAITKNIISTGVGNLGTGLIGSKFGVPLGVIGGYVTDRAMDRIYETSPTYRDFISSILKTSGNNNLNLFKVVSYYYIYGTQ